MSILCFAASGCAAESILRGGCSICGCPWNKVVLPISVSGLNAVCGPLDEPGLARIVKVCPPLLFRAVCSSLLLGCAGGGLAAGGDVGTLLLN